MYQKGAKGWLKHFDFMLLDLIVLQLSFLVAFQIRHGMVNPYADRDYLALAIITELADIVAMIFLNTYEGVLRRGHFKEFALYIPGRPSCSCGSYMYMPHLQ